MKTTCTANWSMSSRANNPQPLLRLFGGGEAVDSQADLIDLDRPEAMWLVEQGTVDVFLAEVQDGDIVAPLEHVMQASPGQLLFGFEQREGIALKAKTSLDAVVWQMPVPQALQADPQLERALAAGVDAWVGALSAKVAEGQNEADTHSRLVRPGEVVELAAGESLAARTGVVWVSSSSTALSLLGLVECRDSDTTPVPVSRAWVTVSADARIETRSTADLLRDNRLFAALAAFHAGAMEAAHLNAMLAVVDAANIRRDRVALRYGETERARNTLHKVAYESTGADMQMDSAPLAFALATIGAYEGITFRQPDVGARGPTLEETTAMSGVRGRPVNLRSSERWWREDSGALLAFRAVDLEPVALVPTERGYRLESEGAKAVEVTAAVARSLADAAWAFVRPLPQQADGWQLARVAMRKTLPDLVRFFAAGLLASLLAFAPAFVIRALVDGVLPNRDIGLLQVAIAALGVLAVIGFLVGVYQSTALARVDGRMAARATAAVWDRLLSAPLDAFGTFAAGELAERAMSFQTLREQVAGIVANAVLSLVFLVPTFALLFHFSAVIGWAGLIAGGAALGTLAVLGAMQGPRQRRLVAAARKLSGITFEFIEGMAKLRATGAEESAFALWARRYSERKRTEVEALKLGEATVAFVAALPILMTAAFFAAVVVAGEGLSVADFVAAYAASMVFFAAVAQLGTAVETVARLTPTFAQVRPILEAEPDTADEDAPVVDLRGRLQFERVSFRYPMSSKPVLDDISIHVEPGEFVALVGESGAGKSTLFRLALGLAEPTSGSVYYDSHDLANISRRATRQQIGVVSQNAVLRPGTIFQNILGFASDLTIDDAWEAARAAAVDKDILQMPMQMHTAVVGGTGSLSGGQIQRILIAAALVRRPRIVMLDEATNWLDTDSQARVMASLAGLSATRVVVAHRLSTIKNADRIYVFDQGRVVQTGTFDELADVDGAMQRLIRRQRL